MRDIGRMTDPWLPIDELRKRTTEKWRAHPVDVLPLFVAEMDTGLAEPVVRAVTEAMALGNSGYPIGSGYAEAFTAFAGKRWGWEPAVEHTLLVPDVMAGLAEVLRAATDPGDPIIVNDPVYPPFYEMIRHLGRRVVEVPLTAEHRLDLDALAAAFAELGGQGRVAHLLCNPQNPTGTVHTRDELTALCRARHRARGARGGRRDPRPARGRRLHAVPDRARHRHGDRAALGVEGLEPRGAEGGAGRRGRRRCRGAGGPAEHGHRRGEPHRGARARRGPERGWALARRPAGRPRPQPRAAGRPRRRAPARRDLPPGAVDVPGVARLPGRRSRRRPGRRCSWNGVGWRSCPGPSFGTSGAGYVRLNLATSPEIITEAVRRMATALPG